MRYYGCATCHTIPGVPTATGRVGPPLQGLRERAYLGGVVSNTPENLVRWIQHPRKLSPKTAMPDTGISENDAKDIAAYLYSR
jgi:cytochrome c2